jgi:methylated-DNA-[protein]-cysteine S-methyltransferase
VAARYGPRRRGMTEPLSCLTVDSPVGPLVIAARDGRLAGLRLPDVGDDGRTTAAPLQGWQPVAAAAGVLADATEQLDAYFTGELTAFDLPLDLQGTDFQRRVWAALQQIPYGTTAGYGELARELGSPGASRAVGLANGRNPVAIVVPCHRVIGADGTLTGFGGGLPCKRWLLDHETGRDRLFTL